MSAAVTRARSSGIRAPPTWLLANWSGGTPSGMYGKYSSGRASTSLAVTNRMYDTTLAVHPAQSINRCR